jgi:hypothetical protein
MSDHTNTPKPRIKSDTHTHTLKSHTLKSDTKFISK